MKKKYSIRLTVGSMFLLATFITAAVAISLQYYFSYHQAKEATLERYQVASEDIAQYLEQLENDTAQTTTILARMAQGYDFKPESLKELVKLYAEVMLYENTIYSVYIGNDQDKFHQLINLNVSDEVRERSRASAADRWAIVTVEDVDLQRVKTTAYLDSDLNVRYVKKERSNYFPTQRPWYHFAPQNVTKTEPYLFQHFKVSGQTFSKRLHNENAVLGVDVLLSGLATKLADEFNQIEAEAFLLDTDGQVIASNRDRQAYQALPPAPPLPLTEEQRELIFQSRSLKVSNQLAWGPIDYSIAAQPRGYAVDILDMIAISTGLKLEYINGFDWHSLSSQFENGSLDILNAAPSGNDLSSAYHLSDPLFRMNFGLVGVDSAYLESLTASMRRLEGRRIAVLSSSPIAEQVVTEFPDVSWYVVNTVREGIQSVLAAQVDGFFVAEYVVKQTIRDFFPNVQGLSYYDIPEFNAVNSPSFHIAMGPMDKGLIEIINLAITHISPMQKRALSDKWLMPTLLPEDQSARNDFLLQEDRNVSLRREFFEVLHRPHLYGQLHSFDSEEGNDGHFYFVYPISTVERKSVNPQDGLKTPSAAKEYVAVSIPQAVVYGKVLEQTIRTTLFTSLLLFVFIPFAWFFATPIVEPIIQLRREAISLRRRHFDEVIQSISKRDETKIKELDDLACAMRDMAKSMQKYQNQQSQFTDELVDLLAHTVESSSPQREGEVARVTQLSRDIAKAVSKDSRQEFAEFQLFSDQQWREFTIAAGLYHTGLIAVPDQLLSKKTKLETRYNRIHEIRTRFEVLWRDAEISQLRARLVGRITEEQAGVTLSRLKRELEQDFEFIAEINQAQRTLSQDDLERIRNIGSRTWLRHFDDRLGLSEEALTRYVSKRAPLPVEEPLLSDRPEHLIEAFQARGYTVKVPNGQNVANRGAKPDYIGNRGELYNLSAQDGCFTQHEKALMDACVVHNSDKLAAMSYPPELSKVPLYLTAKAMLASLNGDHCSPTHPAFSMAEKIMVLAEAFYDLTRCRSDKSTLMCVNEALDTLHEKALQGDVDLAVFLLFVENEIYKDFADQHLQEVQHQRVDIAKYRRKAEVTL